MLTKQDVITMKAAAFALEAQAHLQGKTDLLPVADGLRDILKRETEQGRVERG